MRPTRAIATRCRARPPTARCRARGTRYDPGGGHRDGLPGVAARTISRTTSADIEDVAATTPSLREHLGEQFRLPSPIRCDRMIGAHLIALLCPAGRLTAEPAAIAAAMGVALERVEAVRARMMRFDPVGLFARDLRECLAAQLAERNRLDPAMQALLDNLDAAGAARHCAG